MNDDGTATQPKESDIKSNDDDNDGVNIQGQVKVINENHSNDDDNDNDITTVLQSPSSSNSSSTIGSCEGNIELKNLAKKLLVCLRIEDRSHHFKTYKQCFVGSEAVECMINEKIATNESEAIELGNRLIVAGVWSHVLGEHTFKNEYLFYRFVHHNPSHKRNITRTLLLSNRSDLPLFFDIEQLRTIATRMLHGVEIKDRTYHLKSYSKCFVGEQACVWLVNEKIAVDSGEAEYIGNHLMTLGVFQHVTNDHEFKNDFLFYRFRIHQPGFKKQNPDISDEDSLFPPIAPPDVITEPPPNDTTNHHHSLSRSGSINLEAAARSLSLHDELKSTIESFPPVRTASLPHFSRVPRIPSTNTATLRILLLGTEKSGKTCLLKRFLNGTYNPNNYVATHGATLLESTFYVNDSALKLNGQLWDMGGHPRFWSMCPLYTRKADVVVLVISAKKSLESSIRRTNQFIEDDGVQLKKIQAPIVIAYTKFDTISSENESTILNNIEEYGHSQFEACVFPVSSRTGDGIAALFAHTLTVAASYRLSKIISENARAGTACDFTEAFALTDLYRGSSVLPVHLQRIDALNWRGYLEKRGDLNPSWKKRYFRLYGTGLYYYKDDVTPLHKYTGCICITDAVIKMGRDVISRQDPDNKDKRRILLIRTFAPTERTYKLRSPNEHTNKLIGQLLLLARELGLNHPANQAKRIPLDESE